MNWTCVWSYIILYEQNENKQVYCVRVLRNVVYITTSERLWDFLPHFCTTHVADFAGKKSVSLFRV